MAPPGGVTGSTSRSERYCPNQDTIVTRSGTAREGKGASRAVGSNWFVRFPRTEECLLLVAAALSGELSEPAPLDEGFAWLGRGLASSSDRANPRTGGIHGRGRRPSLRRGS